MDGSGDDEILDFEWFDDWSSESQSGHVMPDFLSPTDGDCEGLISDLLSVVDSDCNSIPDMLSITDADAQSESRHSMPDLQSVTDSDCESLILDSQSGCDDSIPDLLDITDSDSECSPLSDSRGRGGHDGRLLALHLYADKYCNGATDYISKDEYITN